MTLGTKMGSVGNQKYEGTGEYKGLEKNRFESDGPSLLGNIKMFAILGLALTILFATSGCSPEDMDEVDEAEQTAQVAKSQFMKCDALDSISKPVLISNNLGNHGPDLDKPEGMIYKASISSNFTENKSVRVEIHAVGDYDRDDKMELFNGVRGHLYSILIKSGTSLKFTISAYDDQTGLPLTLPYFSVTFMDLDTAPAGKSKEYFIAEDFEHYYVSADTKVKVTTSGGRTKFSASTVGTRDDNAEEPDAFTIAEKAKGVTLQYHNRSKVTLIIGAEDGNKAAAGYNRGMTFTLRPSLLCAKTILADKSMVDPMDKSIDGVEWPLMDGVKSTNHMEGPKTIIQEKFLV